MPPKERSFPAVSRRVVVEGVSPEVDAGRFPIKRTVGEKVLVEADVFTDGHDAVACVLKHREVGDPDWTETSMKPLVNDRWQGGFRVGAVGRHVYTVEGWVDFFRSWHRDLEKRIAAGQDVRVDLQIGAHLVRDAARRASGDDRSRLTDWAAKLDETAASTPDLLLELTEELAPLMSRYPDRTGSTAYSRELPVVVDRERARFSSWYELFPRSVSGQPGRHGTLEDCGKRLEYVARMGFDVVYLPPIHPIGRTHRKGRNNSTRAEPGDVGSPWAIGASEGGHKAVHPDLGSVEDLQSLVERAKALDMEVALDIAFQCSPDHPYVKEHPTWFRQRPDGTVQYAENPPKKYEDIYPFDFDTPDWQALWEELRSVFIFWIEQGVRIFRVDNPHTKPFRFWEWLIKTVKAEHPDVLFLSEAFTRPKVMYNLAKRGFTQSYTYFTWRNTSYDIREYFQGMAQSEVLEFFRPNLWPNTPDILPEYLQFGGRPAFLARLVLAATLGASYGIYGPAFELCENRPRESRSEEYLNSEKYEVKQWDIDSPTSLAEIVGRVNAIRRSHPALQSDRGLQFHAVDNDQLICYSKATDDKTSIVMVVVNLSPHYTHSGWVDLDLEALGLDSTTPYQAHDLLSESRFLWHGPRNFVRIDPAVIPAHIFAIRRHVRREQDFDYFM